MSARNVRECWVCDEHGLRGIYAATTASGCFSSSSPSKKIFSVYNKMSDESKISPKPSAYRSRDWIATIYSEERPTFDPDYHRYFRCIQEKCPKTQRLHWQCNFVCLEAHTLRAIKKKMGNWHFEPRSGTFAEADDYCMLGKPEYTRKRGLPPDTSGIDGTQFVAGSAPAPGERSDLTAACDKFLAEGWSGVPNHIIVRYHRGLSFLDSVRFKRVRKEKTILWFNSEEEMMDHFDTLGLDGYMLQMRGGWFDGYQKEPVLLISDYDDKYFPHRELRALTSKYPHDLPVKGGFTPSNFHIILIYSRLPKESWGY